MKRLFQIPFLGVLVLLLMANKSCDPASERPRWRAQFYAGFAERSSIFRAQDNSEIECRDKKFDDFVCVTYGDLEKLEEEVLSKCERWRN